jgi:hypothetical protein
VAGRATIIRIYRKLIIEQSDFGVFFTFRIKVFPAEDTNLTLPRRSFRTRDKRNLVSNDMAP